MAMVGKRTKLTPEIQAKIVEAIRAGNYQQVAAAYAGVKERAFYVWMEKGRLKNAREPYKQFAQAVSEALAYSEAQAVVTIALAGKQDWRASAWLLERSKRSRWGAHITVDGLRQLTEEQIAEIIEDVAIKGGRVDGHDLDGGLDFTDEEEV